MAKVTALMTEPSSKTPLVILFIWSLLKLLFSSFGLKSGSEARASTSPVVMSITMPPPAMARNFAIDCVSSSIKRGLHPDVDRHLRGLGLVLARIGKRSRIDRALAIEVFLDAGDALGVEVDVADDMR